MHSVSPRGRLVALSAFPLSQLAALNRPLWLELSMKNSFNPWPSTVFEDAPEELAAESQVYSSFDIARVGGTIEIEGES